VSKSIETVSKPHTASKAILQLNVIPLHQEPCSFEDEAYVATFNYKNGNTEKSFKLLPASKNELIQLALFLGTCSNFQEKVKHEIVPGQYIVSEPNFGNNVKITLITSSEILEILQDTDLTQKLDLSLNFLQLEAYEEFIISAIQTNANLHGLNLLSQMQQKQFDLAA
jgi:hypothetical protein